MIRDMYSIEERGRCLKGYAVRPMFFVEGEPKSGVTGKGLSNKKYLIPLMDSL